MKYLELDQGLPGAKDEISRTRPGFNGFGKDSNIYGSIKHFIGRYSQFLT